MVVFDTSFLLLALDPSAKPPLDPSTQEPLSQVPERMDFLIQSLSSDGETIVIPTPVLSEILVHAGDAIQTFLDAINSDSVFRVADFDQRAAIEAALATKSAILRGGRRIDSGVAATGAKIKFDRQIVAIAMVENAHTIYSDDSDIAKYASHASIRSVRTVDLPLPPEDPQQSFSV